VAAPGGLLQLDGGAAAEPLPRLEAWLCGLSPALAPHAPPLAARLAAGAARLDDAELRALGLSAPIHRHALLHALAALPLGAEGGEGYAGTGAQLRGATHHNSRSSRAGGAERTHIVHWEAEQRAWGAEKLAWMGVSEDAAHGPAATDAPAERAEAATVAARKARRRSSLGRLSLFGGRTEARPSRRSLKPG